MWIASIRSMLSNRWSKTTAARRSPIPNALQPLCSGPRRGRRCFFRAEITISPGSAAPNRGTIESTATGQVFRGEGAGTTRIFQTDARRDFGFVCREDLKRVPAATIRIPHKGCVIDGMTVALDRQTPSKTIAGTAAIQIAHIAYHPDNNVGIIETTGRGADFLLDHVIVSRVNVGEQLGSGILSDKFFEVGIDIIGSGGHVRVSDVNRLDARTGIRLDNGNHCGQGEYQFESIYCMGNPAVFRDGVFFDWVGGQAPSIHNSSCSFTSGIFAGPRGKFGDRLNPYPEAEVVRRPGRDWDWLTLHGHSVVDDPNPAQRTEWYGLPRYAEVVRIGSEPPSAAGSGLRAKISTWYGSRAATATRPRGSSGKAATDRLPAAFTT